MKRFRELIIDKPKRPKGDNEYFEVLTKAVFRAGFDWEVVEYKWPNFRKSFAGFDIGKVAKFDHRDEERFLKDVGIVRNVRKIRATIANARILEDIIRDYGSVAGFIKSFRKLSYRERNKKLTKTFKNFGRTGAFVFLWTIGEDVPNWEER